MDDSKGYAVLQHETESTLGWFKKRQEIEARYASELSALSKEWSKKQDEELDQLTNLPTTWRKALAQVKNNTAEEASAHSRFAHATAKVVSSLSGFRDDKERMRRRIKEDVRNAENEHIEYKQAVARLRRTYETRVGDLRSHEEEEYAREKELSFPPEHWGSGSESGASAVGGAGAGAGGASAGGRGRADSATSSSRGTSPPPPLISPPIAPQVFVSGATSLGSASTSGYRDPPSGKANVFDQLAKRDWAAEGARLGRKAVGVLGKGNDGPSGAAGRGVNRSREVASRMKREAEKADRDYRDGVHQLETLRLQRDRVSRSAAQSLREYAYEISALLKQLLDSHVTEIVSLGHYETAVGEHSRPEVAKINPDEDALAFARRLRDPSPAEQPVFYQNFFVGECKSLLFGVSLSDYHSQYPKRLVPLIVQRCIDRVDQSLDTEGIYRVSGKLATIQSIVNQIEKDENAFEFSPNEEPHTVTGLLKLYLRQLPMALFFFPLADRVAFSTEFAAKKDTALAQLARRVKRLPVSHQATLKALLEHLARVVSHSQENKMNASNVGVVFSAFLFGEEHEATLESAKLSSNDRLMEILITNHQQIFDGLAIEPLATTRSRNASTSAAGLPTPTFFSPPRSPSLMPIQTNLTLATNGLPAGLGGVDSSAPSPSGTSPITPASALSPPTSESMSTSAQSRDSVMGLWARASNEYNESAKAAADAGDQTQPQAPAAEQPAVVEHTPTVTSVPVSVAHSTSLPAAAFGSPSTTDSPQSRHSPDFDSPAPPLSAAEGRRIPSEE